MPCFSLVSIQMPLLILLASMVGALYFKVRNGQQQSGFMWIPLTKLWVPMEIAPMLMRTVRDGLLLANAPRILSICWEVQTFQDIVGRAAKHVKSVCFLSPTKLVSRVETVTVIWFSCLYFMLTFFNFLFS